MIFCPTVSTGAFVARRNGKIFITGNSGFPKSLDISKAIDKVKGAERDVIGIKPIAYPDSGCWGIPNIASQGGKIFGGESNLPIGDGNIAGGTPITAPATPEAQLWDGYGTALKPAYEPIILAMNPLDKTFANNALVHGVAGLNIDECRVSLSGDSPSGSAKRVFKSNQYTDEKIYGDNKFTPLEGRFPANFLHDGSDEVLELFSRAGVRLAGGFPRLGKGFTGKSNITFRSGEERAERINLDSGSAARFFYCAKASRSERNKGCEGLPLKSCSPYEFNDDPSFRNVQGRSGDNKTHNNHPTVKPLALMTYLCKLVKMPEYNLVLDPFCGSGTTLLACGSLGIRSIGIDSDEKSCEIAANRCAADSISRIQKGEY